ncbi:MAG: preprotein translocase subunit SecG [Flavobacteriales bacterium]|nr:preprotein translocase subunit SecG [Flavobacteriales bacterium]MCX7769005.1 preprotein translocase subunit SecG [Flavobacteriales bacterium]MDW8410206.1 preprotein translocase subunit SecG [Flavobacteriales bacterium]
MEILFSILLILVAIALIGIVLIQNAKGGGLAANVGLTPQMLGGVRKATEDIEKVTWGLAIALFLLCLASGFIFQSRSSEVPTPKVQPVELQAPGELPPPTLSPEAPAK